MTFSIELVYFLFSIYITVFISTVMHEIGHYLIARLLGYKPKYFITGTRAPVLNKLNSLISFKLSNTDISINPLGLGGLVDLDSYIKNVSCFKIKIMCFSGPLMNFILFYISFLFAMYYYGYDDKFSNIYLDVFMACNFFMFILNLYPSKKSDGWYILNISDEVKDGLFVETIAKEKIINIVSLNYYKKIINKPTPLYFIYVC